MEHTNTDHKMKTKLLEWTIFLITVVAVGVTLFLIGKISYTIAYKQEERRDAQIAQGVMQAEEMEIDCYRSALLELGYRAIIHRTNGLPKRCELQRFTNNMTLQWSPDGTNWHHFKDIELEQRTITVTNSPGYLRVQAISHQ